MKCFGVADRWAEPTYQVEAQRLLVEPTWSDAAPGQISMCSIPSMATMVFATFLEAARHRDTSNAIVSIPFHDPSHPQWHVVELESVNPLQLPCWVWFVDQTSNLAVTKADCWVVDWHP